MELIIMVGLQGSGKSTFRSATYPNYTVISGDLLSSRERRKSLQIQLSKLADAISNGENVVLDNTSPTKEVRSHYINAAKAAGYKVIACYIYSTIDESIARNDKREGKAKVPHIAIYTTAKKMIYPSLDEGFDTIRHYSLISNRFELGIEINGT